MNQKLNLAVLAVILLVSCQNPPARIVSETFPDGSPKVVKYYQLNGRDSVLLKEEVFYQSGKRYMMGKYSNGKRDSIWTAWLEDGRVWSKGGYREGLEDGPKEVYHPNGSLFYKGQYKLGKRVGVWEFRNDKGERVQTLDYGPEGEQQGN